MSAADPATLAFAQALGHHVAGRTGPAILAYRRVVGAGPRPAGARGHPAPQACTRQGQPEQGTAPGHSGRGRLATGSATTLDFSDGHAHMCTLDLARALGKGRQQGLVGQQVDGADAPARGVGLRAQRELFRL